MLRHQPLECVFACEWGVPERNEKQSREHITDTAAVKGRCFKYPLFNIKTALAIHAHALFFCCL